MIPYGRQSIDESDIAAVVEALRQPFLTQGPIVPRFEAAVAERVGARHGVAVSSATAGLHLACLALGLGPGGLLWTVPNTFVASANAGRYCGAAVDFVDIDPATYLLDVDRLSARLAEAEAAGRLPDIVMPVHFAGQSCDMARIGELAQRYGFRVIEDAAHALGATYRDRPVGCCEHADIAVFSFHPVKIVTTAEGGLCTTNDPVLARRLQLLCSHGITKDPAEFDRPAEGPWDYRQVALGFNYRMTEIQAALGLSQMARLDRFLERRRAIAAGYDAALRRLAATGLLERPYQRPDTNSSWHLYVIQVAAGRRAAIFQHMRTSGVGVQVLYIPVHRQPYYAALGFGAGDYPAAEAYYRRSFTLPIFPELTEAAQMQAVDALHAALEAAPEPSR